MDVQLEPGPSYSGLSHLSPLSQANMGGAFHPATAPTVPANAAVEPLYYDNPDLLHYQQLEQQQQLQQLQQQQLQQQQLQQQQLQQQQQPQFNHVAGSGNMRKRKAESQDNERLSKRMSLLNLEQNGQKMYVAVESPASRSIAESPDQTSNSSSNPQNAASTPETMVLDDSPHKVYIYDLDAELADSASATSSPPSSPRLRFINDLDKHLRTSRIPASVLASQDDGSIAGMSPEDMQLVLYRETPDTISGTVPADLDPVRRAVAEARARVRARQSEEMSEGVPLTPELEGPRVIELEGDEDEGVQTGGGLPQQQPAPVGGEDPDAMELD
ncbi:hypothetical protein F4780DRAFT_739312 [Xylariomycetidae sp. FL0641]|nr:hypothetical protein F4780DRAFT_739312 [Xylariomycetidae sp. FL0641]